MTKEHAEAVELCNEGVQLAQQGAYAAAAEALSRAAELWAEQPLIHYNLGRVLRSCERLPEARRAYEQALSLRPDADTHNNLGLVLHEMGLIEQACAHLQAAVQLAPELAAAWCNLGNALRELGQRSDADAAFVRALELDNECVAARYNRFATLYEPKQPEPAISWLSQLLAHSPQHHLACYQWAAARLASERDLDASTGRLVVGQLAVGRLQKGWWEEACTMLREGGAAHLASSLTFMRDHWGPDTQLFADSRETLAFALQQASVRGSVLELGVRFGHSLRFIAEHVDQPVHGFDSFEGLPEDWGERGAGLYTTEGKLPPVPEHVTLHVGLFAETVPRFVTKHPAPLRLANIDCDIYASTRDALTALDDTIVPGSILVFDEYLGNPNWQQDEHRALTQWATAAQATLSYLAFSPFSRQAVVKVISR